MRSRAGSEGEERGEPPRVRVGKSTRGSVLCDGNPRKAAGGGVGGGERGRGERGGGSVEMKFKKKKKVQ